ncbi:hypothetical protein [Sphingobium olei]|uniref:Uncharacterized protein n=1 Tax=Sphingobium olei TaxID=420955 RepID=A0ABW3P6Q6_9SPHN
MTITNRFDRAYFLERIETNRQLAEKSHNPIIRDLHLEYIRLYEHLLEAEVPA